MKAGGLAELKRQFAVTLDGLFLVLAEIEGDKEPAVAQAGAETLATRGTVAFPVDMSKQFEPRYFDSLAVNVTRERDGVAVPMDSRAWRYLLKAVSQRMEWAFQAEQEQAAKATAQRPPVASVSEAAMPAGQSYCGEFQPAEGGEWFPCLVKHGEGVSRVLTCGGHPCDVPNARIRRVAQP